VPVGVAVIVGLLVGVDVEVLVGVGVGVLVGVPVEVGVVVTVGVLMGVLVDVLVGVDVPVAGPETITVAPAGEPVQNATTTPLSSIAVNVSEVVLPTLANVTGVPEVACFALKRMVAAVKAPPIWVHAGYPSLYSIVPAVLLTLLRAITVEPALTRFPCSMLETGLPESSTTANVAVSKRMSKVTTLNDALPASKLTFRVKMSPMSTVWLDG